MGEPKRMIKNLFKENILYSISELAGLLNHKQKYLNIK